MKRYEIAHARDPDWQKLPAIEVDEWQWQAKMNIRMQAKLCWDAQGLKLFLQAWEKDIRAEHTQPLDMVCEDSCMEFFLRPDENDLRYFNFEINPNGAMFAGFGTGREEIVRLILPKTYDLRQKTQRTPDGWTAQYCIPAGLIRTFFPGFRMEPGMRMRANFYKCGHKTRHPHYITWNPVDSPVPSFHRPQDFGEIILL